jgi:hypothetical protein
MLDCKVYAGDWQYFRDSETFYSREDQEGYEHSGCVVAQVLLV